MRKTAIIVLWATIFSTPYPYPCLGGDNPAYPAGSKPAGVEICFPLPDGERILRDLESLPPTKAALEACSDLSDANEVRAEALESRVAEQDRELKDARKVIDDTRKAGEEAVKVASGPWYARVLAVAKWGALFFLGGLVVGGMAK